MISSITGSESPPPHKDRNDLEPNLVDTWERPDQYAVEDLRKPWNSSSSSESFETEGGIPSVEILPPCEPRNIVDGVRNDIDEYELKKNDKLINSKGDCAFDGGGAGGKSVKMLEDEKAAKTISSSYRRRAFKNSPHIDMHPLSTTCSSQVFYSPDHRVKSYLPSQHLQDITTTSPHQPRLVSGTINNTASISHSNSKCSSNVMVTCGILLKKSRTFKYWRQRFVVLNSEGCHLEWYKRRANYIGEEPTNCIIRILPSTKLWQKTNSTQFSLQNSNHEVTFDASTHDELMRWLEPLCRAFRHVLQRAQNLRAPEVLTIISQPSRLSDTAWFEEEDIDDHHYYEEEDF